MNSEQMYYFTTIALNFQGEPGNEANWVAFLMNFQ